MKETRNVLVKALSPLYDKRETTAIIELLFEEVCGMNRAEQILHQDDVLPDEVRTRLEGYAASLAEGVPVQHVLGYETFAGRRFSVNSDVLIPRPETAELVHWIVKDQEELHAFSTPVDNSSEESAVNVLDIGTGSGCIATSLALDINNSRVVAIDLSTPALKTARDNAKKLNANNVKFVKMNILETVQLECMPSYQQSGESITPVTRQALKTLVDNGSQLTPTGLRIVSNIEHVLADSEAFESDFDGEAMRQKMYDVIVSNPPYVREWESTMMEAHVLNHEPAVALFVPDNDPLLFYRSIARYAKQHLKKGGHLYFEINAALGQEVCELLHFQGFRNVILRQDVNGRDRMVRATL